MHHSNLITHPEVANTGPGVNRGSGGGARGCGFEELQTAPQQKKKLHGLSGRAQARRIWVPPLFSVVGVSVRRAPYRAVRGPRP